MKRIEFYLIFMYLLGLEVQVSNRPIRLVIKMKKEMDKASLLYLFYFLIKFSLISVSICWFFFHNLYIFAGTNSDGSEVYVSFGLLKICFETNCYFNPDKRIIFRILCGYYLFSITLEIIITFISIRCLKFRLSAMILSFRTCLYILKYNIVITFIPVNIIAFYIYFLFKTTDSGVFGLDKNILKANTVNFSFWNMINFPITVLNFVATIFIFLIRRQPQKTPWPIEPCNY
ncbi:LOW QUALITY PROTEIN: hypothetical protein HZS_1333 [Henneguya salminicola]|nr:LOW QUALITY PROTEIN: hypothetical protein HZS_1333 [Henneguya salminicola]